jgi:hypothetical protein
MTNTLISPNYFNDEIQNIGADALSVIPQQAGPTTSAAAKLSDIAKQEYYGSIANVNNAIADSMNWNKSFLKEGGNWYNPLDWQGGTYQALGTLGQLGSGLANIYLGFQQYDIAKDQLGLAKEQWATTKAEIDRINTTRDKLSSQYMGA